MYLLVKLALTAFNKIINIGKIDMTLLLDAAQKKHNLCQLAISKVGLNLTVLQLAKMVYDSI